MDQLRTTQRLIALAAVGLPLLLASPVMALAHDDDYPTPPKPYSHSENNAVVLPELTSHNESKQHQDADS